MTEYDAAESETPLKIATSGRTEMTISPVRIIAQG